MERKKTAASFSDVAKKTPLRKPKVGWLNKLGGEGDGWLDDRFMEWIYLTAQFRQRTVDLDLMVNPLTMKIGKL